VSGKKHSSFTRFPHPQFTPDAVEAPSFVVEVETQLNQELPSPVPETVFSPVVEPPLEEPPFQDIPPPLELPDPDIAPELPLAPEFPELVFHVPLDPELPEFHELPEVPLVPAMPLFPLHPLELDPEFMPLFSVKADDPPVLDPAG